MCVVVMLAFKPPGSVRSKAAIMCCLCVVYSLFVFCFQCGLWHCWHLSPQALSVLRQRLCVVYSSFVFAFNVCCGIASI